MESKITNTTTLPLNQGSFNLYLCNVEKQYKILQHVLHKHVLYNLTYLAQISSTVQHLLKFKSCDTELVFGPGKALVKAPETILAGEM